ncbi:MAG: hypothetical protein ACREUX_09890 [Burkholderiales bacterium]
MHSLPVERQREQSPPRRARRARMGYVELGAIWSPRADIELAFGIIRQVGDGEPTRQTLTAGLTWRF